MSPTIASLVGTDLQGCADGKDHGRVGLDPDAVVAAGQRRDVVADAEAAERCLGRARGRRWSRRRFAGRRPERVRTAPAGRPAARARRDRVGLEPGVSTARRAAATLGHQRRRTAPTSSSISAIVATASGAPGRTRPPTGSKPIVAKTSPATGRRVAPRGAPEVERPAAPHRVEIDQRAVLVEDDEIDPVEDRVREPRRARARRAGHSASAIACRSRRARGPAPRTSVASGGNETVTSSPIAGACQARVVELVERDGRVAVRPTWTRVRTIEPRKLTSSTSPRRRLPRRPRRARSPRAGARP